MELERVDRITSDALGEPGDRTFYLQVRKGPDLISVLVEKQHIQLLAASILEILERAGKETGEGPAEEDMALEEPIEPIWRAGRLSIGYEEAEDVVVLEIEELVPDEEQEEREPDHLRVWATREQMLALSRHGALVSERGRPSCQFCGNPMDADGHVCPAMNGHSAPT
ncbi:MAG: DUF3090 domain-containing protein [Actinomycetota bacterium]